MNIVGFEAFVLEPVITGELFSCFATTLLGTRSCVYLIAKGKISHFNLWWPRQVRSVGSVLLLWRLIVEMFNNLTRDLRCKLKNQSYKRKINQMINLNFILLFFPLALPPLGNIFRLREQIGAVFGAFFHACSTSKSVQQYSNSCIFKIMYWHKIHPLF